MKKVSGLYVFGILLLLIMVGGVAYYFMPQGQKYSERNARELAVLDELIEKKQFFRDSMEAVIADAMIDLQKHDEYSDSLRYLKNRYLLMRSQMYSFDHASQFASKMITLSEKIGNKDLQAEAHVLSSFYLTQACLFVEAMEMLNYVDENDPEISDSTRCRYFFYSGINYQRMAVYVRDSINSNKYNRLGEEMFRKCADCTKSEAQKNFVLGRISERRNDYVSARKYYKKALEAQTDDSRIILRSLITSSLAKANRMLGYSDDALYYYIRCTQHNILYEMNSSIAIVDMVEYIFEEFDDPERANDYLSVSIENGEFFGMRSQVTRADKMIPFLNRESKSNMIQLTLFVSGLFLLVIVFAVILYMRHERNIVLLEGYEKENKHHKEEKQSRDSENKRLERVCKELKQANDIKNTYIGQLLESNSEMAGNFRDFILKVGQRVRKENYDAAMKIINEYEHNYNSKELYVWLDELILTLFPNYADDFNSLLPEDLQVILKEKNQLNPSMRIFALIRLGLKDNHQIARVLNYSYNTVLNYRVRTRNSAISPETFEKNIMRIGGVE